MGDRALARIVFKRFEILRTLYPDEEYTMTELSERTGTDLGNLSKQINGAKNIVGLLEVELPSGEYLIDVREEKRERGRPKKFVKLTEAGRKIISPMITTLQQKPKKKDPADKEEIDLYLDMMKNPPNDEVLKMASEEFVVLCGDRLVTPDEEVLSFLEEKLTDPKYEEIQLNLLLSLQQIIQDTREEEDLSTIKTKFEKPLKEIAENITLEQIDKGKTIRSNAIKTLVEILDEEEEFNELINVYKDGVKKGSELNEFMRRLILTRHPEKALEVKKMLFKLLEDPNEEVRRRARIELRNIRSSQSVTAPHAVRYTLKD